MSNCKQVASYCRRTTATQRSKHSCRLSDGSIGTQVQRYVSPRFCTDRVGDGCDNQGIPQRDRNCFELAVLTAIRKTPWLFRILSKDVQQYVSSGWNSTSGCPRRPRSLSRWYKRITGRQLSDATGGSELALLLTILHKSHISYVGVSTPYRSFFDMTLQQRTEIVSACFTILHLTLSTESNLPTVGSVLHVIRQLLLQETINVSFGFVHMMQKRGRNRHCVGFTVCKNESIVLCDSGNCTDHDYDLRFDYKTYRVYGVVIAVHNPRAPRQSQPFQFTSSS